MTDPFGDPFRDALSSLLGDTRRPPQKGPTVPDKPLPQIRGKQIDGVLYVRAEDVADALESQKAAPRLVAKLRGRKP